MRTVILAILSLLLPAVLLSGCGAPTLPDGGEEMRYARWLRMDDSMAVVLSPWREGEVLGHHALTPCRHAVSQTSLHAWLAFRLGAKDRLMGVMDADYVVAPEVRAALATTALALADAPSPTGEQARLLDMGNSMSPNLERIKASGCDLILASPFENAGYGALETLGIPIVSCADYMEAHPLGRAEWMRFYGRLLGQPARADSLFAAEDSTYQALLHTLTPSSLSSINHKPSPINHKPSPINPPPSTLLGFRTGQSWYVPGGESYLGRLLADAGADYVFADEATTGSVPMDFEAVYSRARDAETWIFTYAAPPGADGRFAPMTRADLTAQDPRYGEFRAFRDRHIWACNTLAVPYYDVLPWQPSTFLRELIALLHPELLPDYQFQYFHRLE